jgi:hypothetical protein
VTVAQANRILHLRILPASDARCLSHLFIIKLNRKPVNAHRGIGARTLI